MCDSLESRRIKRIVVIVGMIGVVALSVAACGSKSAVTTKATPAAPLYSSSPVADPASGVHLTSDETIVYNGVMTLAPKVDGVMSSLDQALRSFSVSEWSAGTSSMQTAAADLAAIKHDWATVPNTGGQVADLQQRFNALLADLQTLYDQTESMQANQSTDGNGVKPDRVSQDRAALYMARDSILQVGIIGN